MTTEKTRREISIALESGTVLLTMGIETVWCIESLEGSERLLAHLAPLPPALDERFAPGLESRADGGSARHGELALLAREVGLACLELALCRGELGANLDFGLDEAEGRRRARGRQDGVPGGLLILRRLDEACHPRSRVRGCSDGVVIV